MPCSFGSCLKPETLGSKWDFFWVVQGMIEDLGGAPKGAIVLLHACAHNPTGVDPSPAQWGAILKTVRERRLLPFFDSAYQVRHHAAAACACGLTHHLLTSGLLSCGAYALHRKGLDGDTTLSQGLAQLY